MAKHGAFASFPQGFRLVKTHIAETNDQPWEGNWIGENCGLLIITISSQYKSSLSIEEWSAFSITFVSMVLPYRFSHTLTHYECDCRCGWKTMRRVDWNLTVCEYIHSCDTVTEALRMWNSTSTVRESCDLLHENTVFYGVYEFLPKALFFKMVYFSSMS